MLVRLRDFAELHRISERTVQLHIKENWDVLENHVDRRGKQGTWLDDFAQTFLLDRIQLPSKDEVIMPSPREAALLIQIAEANKALAEAERRAGENAEAAGRVKLLEATTESQTAQISELSILVGKLTEQVAVAEKRAAEAIQSVSQEKRKASAETQAIADREKEDLELRYEMSLEQRDKRIAELEARTLGSYIKDFFKRK